MKRIMIALAFFVAFVGAFAFRAKPLAPEPAYFRNPDIAHCTLSSELCDITKTNPCILSNMKQGYRQGCTQVLFRQN